MTSRPFSKSWEGWGPASASVDADAEFRWDDEEMPFNYDDLSPPEASELLADLLIELKLSGKLSAKHCCSLAYLRREDVNARFFRS